MHKNPLFNFALVALALFVGYGLGKRGAPVSDQLRPFEKVPTQKEIDYKVKYESMKSRFDQINKVDFEEYLNLKSQKEKYNKANEILGKILVVFLAELGLKVSNEARDYAEKATNSPEDIAYKEPKVESDERREKPPSDEKAKEEWKTRQRRITEKKINAVDNEEEAKDFLDKVAFEDFSKEASKSIPLQERQYRIIRGTYIGVLKIEKPVRETKEIEMTFQAIQDDWKKNTKYKITVFDKGEAISTSSGDGIPSSFRSLGEDSNGIIIQLGGKMGYLQLYYAPGMRRLIGNYYRPFSFGSFQKAGTVFMEPR